jgi:hypothetical protein
VITNGSTNFSTQISASLADPAANTTEPKCWPNSHRSSSLVNCGRRDFVLEPLAEGCALLTYRSASITADGTLERHTNRSSVWQLTPEGWKMLFHQGTPTTPFEKHAT